MLTLLFVVDMKCRCPLVGYLLHRFLGSATYAMYVAANIKEERILLFAAAALMGFGAALLWVAQGAHIAKCSREYELKYRLTIGSTTGYLHYILFVDDVAIDVDIRYFMGLFWGWMVLNQFVGNSIAAALFYADTTTTTVYVIFSIINVGGVFLFLLIRSFPVRHALSAANEAQQTHEHSVDITAVGVQSQLMEVHAVCCVLFLSLLLSLSLLTLPRSLSG